MNEAKGALRSETAIVTAGLRRGLRNGRVQSSSRQRSLDHRTILVPECQAVESYLARVCRGVGSKSFHHGRKSSISSPKA